ncbi:MAG: EF-hand domain-containing protein [Crocinitomicaceae bacterium]
MRNNQKITIYSMAILGLTLLGSCASSKEQPSTSEPPRNQQMNKEQPSVIELLTEMDEDKDGQLSRSEVKGPLEQNFTEIDTNRDDFLSVEELKNAPKPEERPEGRPPRGERPPRGNGGPPRN